MEAASLANLAEFFATLSEQCKVRPGYHRMRHTLNGVGKLHTSSYGPGYTRTLSYDASSCSITLPKLRSATSFFSLAFSSRS
jgi:hypothetical protein